MIRFDSYLSNGWFNHQLAVVGYFFWWCDLEEGKGYSMLADGSYIFCYFMNLFAQDWDAPRAIAFLKMMAMALLVLRKGFEPTGSPPHKMLLIHWSIKPMRKHQIIKETKPRNPPDLVFLQVFQRIGHVSISLEKLRASDQDVQARPRPQRWSLCFP